MFDAFGREDSVTICRVVSVLVCASICCASFPYWQSHLIQFRAFWIAVRSTVKRVTVFLPFVCHHRYAVQLEKHYPELLPYSRFLRCECHMWMSSHVRVLLVSRVSMPVSISVISTASRASPASFCSLSSSFSIACVSICYLIYNTDMFGIDTLFGLYFIHCVYSFQFALSLLWRDCFVYYFHVFPHRKLCNNIGPCWFVCVVFCDSVCLRRR